MDELIAYIRRNPGKLNTAPATAQNPHVGAAQAPERLDIVHIPYKGDSPASADFIAGRIQLLIGTPGTVLLT